MADILRQFLGSCILIFWFCSTTIFEVEQDFHQQLHCWKTKWTQNKVLPWLCKGKLAKPTLQILDMLSIKKNIHVKQLTHVYIYRHFALYRHFCSRIFQRKTTTTTTTTTTTNSWPLDRFPSCPLMSHRGGTCLAWGFPGTLSDVSHGWKWWFPTMSQLIVWSHPIETTETAIKKNVVIGQVPVYKTTNLSL